MRRQMTGQFHTRNRQSGMTLIEMVVSFMLLSLFVSAAAVVIFNITNLYYHVRGENYARQIADIMVNKVSSEITGAVYVDGFDANNPKFYTTDVSGNTISGNALELCDRTNTKVRMYAQDGILKVYYHSIVDEVDHNNDRNAVFWNYDKTVYNGYRIEEMEFAQASKLTDSQKESFGITNTDPLDYDDNIIVVYIRMVSGKYGPFTICRFVRMYNAPENDYTITTETSL